MNHKKVAIRNIYRLSWISHNKDRSGAEEQLPGPTAAARRGMGTDHRHRHRLIMISRAADLDQCLLWHFGLHTTHLMRVNYTGMWLENGSYVSLKATASVCVFRSDWEWQPLLKPVSRFVIWLMVCCSGLLITEHMSNDSNVEECSSLRTTLCNTLQKISYQTDYWCSGHILSHTF